MTVTVYIGNFFWANMITILSTGKIPGMWRWVGMGTMVVGVAHLGGFGVVYLYRLVKRRCSKKVGGDGGLEGDRVGLNETLVEGEVGLAGGEVLGLGLGKEILMVEGKERGGEVLEGEYGEFGIRGVSELEDEDL